MGLLSDLDTIFFQSPAMRKAPFILFLMSVALDIDALFVPVLIRHGIIHPQRWGGAWRILAFIIGVLLMLGTTLLWLLMLNACLWHSGRGIVGQLLFGVAFFLGIWFTAQFYYLFIYRRSGNSPTQETPQRVRARG
jgi:hypothetical protein